LSEAQEDFDAIHARVLEAFGRENSRHRIVVFPSGSSHQIMPPQFAAKVLPSAEFAFHEKDDLSKDYEQAGLTVIRFGNPPEQICELIASASTVFCTDSFPSHLAQMWKDKAVVMMTEMMARITYHPCFPASRVMESRAECNPCRKLVRIGPHPQCTAGRMFCSTWDDPEYLAQFMSYNSV
jgi:hypothetical protein